MKKTNQLIVGSALGLAAIAVAIDHTQHRLPEPVTATQEQTGMSEEESPCSMDEESPCSMDTESPCSMDSDDSDSSPCGLGD
jgi:hypothetical protein